MHKYRYIKTYNKKFEDYKYISNFDPNKNMKSDFHINLVKKMIDKDNIEMQNLQSILDRFSTNHVNRKMIHSSDIIAYITEYVNNSDDEYSYSGLEYDKNMRSDFTKKLSKRIHNDDENGISELRNCLDKLLRKIDKRHIIAYITQYVSPKKTNTYQKPAEPIVSVVDPEDYMKLIDGRFSKKPIR